ncbi:MAG: CvpA family protein [Spirochaetaceae bacterium]|jgi:membrane protein required for colicin V production|nr:CvpA family protein [Spirochaetaceae bacterium]
MNESVAAARSIGLAPIDIIFIALVLILVIRCALRGFIEEVMSMASVVAGVFSAVFFYKRGGAFLRERYLGNLGVVPEILGFIILFLIPFVGIRILEHIIKDIIARVHLGGIDRFLGILFGLVEGIVLIALVLFVIDIQPLFDKNLLLEKSFFAPFLLPVIGEVHRTVLSFSGGGGIHV